MRLEDSNNISLNYNVSYTLAAIYKIRLKYNKYFRTEEVYSKSLTLIDLLND